MNDFYITLPSNSSANTFPHNTQANFTTLLSSPILLEGNYEVALAEIDYSTKIECFMGKLEVTHFLSSIFDFTSTETEIIDIRMRNRLTTKEFAKNLNTLIKSFCTKAISKHIADLYYNVKIIEQTKEMLESRVEFNSNKSNLEKVIFCLYKENDSTESEVRIIDSKASIFSEFYISKNGVFNESLNKWIFPNDNFKEDDKYFSSSINIEYNKWIVNKDYSNDKNIIKVNYDNEKNSIIFESLDEKIKFNWSGNIAYFLFKREEFSSSNLEIFLNSKIIDMINYVCVYTDIIDDQYFGHIKAPILKLITIKPEIDQLVSNLENLQYVNVRKNIINQINIELRDLGGKNIIFLNDFAFVVVKLHLRKVRHNT